MDRRTFLKAIPLPLLAAPAGVRQIGMDSDGMITMDGRREFILGLYQLPRTASPWKEAKEAGFNLVNVQAKAEDFAQAAAHNLHAWVGLGSLSPKKRSADEERIRKIVTAFRNEPALLLWETEDEPSYIWKKTEPRVPPEDIIATYSFVKSLDPAHLLYLNHAPTNLESTLERYNPGADIVATDIYPVAPPGIREMYALWPDGRQGDFLNTFVSQVGQYADKMRRVAGASRAVFLVLQAFAWENLREKDRDPKMILYPTRSQMRFMTYQAIAHGLNGLLYWGLYSNPPDAPLWEDVRAVAGELRELKTELAARKAPLKLGLTYHDVGHSLDRGIEWIAKPGEHGVILMAVNADPNPVEVTFSGLDAFRRCQALFESRTPGLKDGAWRDSFEPFGAHVYRLSF
ncbi:MAG: hypothetical protein HY236_08945 [Acidobacteria bacterium]|nr:hypothetical protein [Acidobacteriota bacterium]